MSDRDEAREAGWALEDHNHNRGTCGQTCCSRRLAGD